MNLQKQGPEERELLRAATGAGAPGVNVTKRNVAEAKVAGKATAKERPILFSGPMVKAILEGRKTQTRRVANVPPDARSVRWAVDEETVPSGSYTGWVVECDAPFLLPRKCPYGQPGDRLWVRETFRTGEEQVGPTSVFYRADADWEAGPWTPSIHMPRWASRITLEITAVRVERLQDISEEDAKAEGVTLGGVKGSVDQPGWVDTNRYAFERTWNSINGDTPWKHWASNPWVWAISFKRLGVK